MANALPDFKAILAGIGDAKVTERGNPLQYITDTKQVAQPDGTIKAVVNKLPAEFELEVTKCVMIRANEGYDAFVATFKVLSSNHPDIKVGESRNWFQKMYVGQKSATSLGALKGFSLAVQGIRPGSAEEVIASKTMSEDLAEVIGDQQAFTGQRVHCVVSHTLTKEGKDFSRHAFGPSKLAA